MFELLLLLFFLHWFGDFVCQTRWMADNKSKNPAALTYHVLIYTAVMAIGLSPWIVWKDIAPESFGYFLIVNFGLHWLTDITTSQFTKYFWAKKDIHKFFATIGFDQCIHQVCLLVTARIFLL
jgi:hypothetical protein